MSIETEVPEIRIRKVNQAELNDRGDWVVYWMTAFRRVRSNFALQYAKDLAKQLDKPLIVLDALRVRYRWASDRFHRFIIEGMRDNASELRDSDAFYYPYVEPTSGAGSGLIETLAAKASAVVTDDYPCFFHPRMIQWAGRKLDTPLFAIDSNCLMPLAYPEREFTVAHSYRRYMQKELLAHLECSPEDNPLDGRSTRTMPTINSLPKAIADRWPAANLEQLLTLNGLSDLPIDHSVEPCEMTGGAQQAEKLLEKFIDQRLTTYGEDRNEPDEYGSSELSPYLHFGHISPHQIFWQLMEQQKWNPSKTAKANGKMNGFWNVSEDAEAFLDQLCTWREIGFIKSWQDPKFDRYETLPEWAQESLEKHTQDDRPYIYSLAEFESADTHDEIWNAAQRQLVREGRIHNYLRMLWGKKILHWTQTPQEALHVMEHLNNKYALDGRDPNSYSGIFWVLGRFDRAWGPERPIFGKIRYMTSENTAKKHALKKYLKRYE